MSLLRIGIIIGSIAVLLACTSPRTPNSVTATTQTSMSVAPIATTARITITTTPIPSVTTTATATATITARATAVVVHYFFPVQLAKVSYGELHHDYPATDIFCVAGSKFVAVTDGVVDFISVKDIWDPETNNPNDRGGLAVAIIGSDGVRYYGSHLQSIAPDLQVGMQVTAGQLLGYTGKTGSAQGTPAHLHFGISRPTTPTDWQARRGEISPYPYLQAWQKGEMRAPILP